ncbi:TadE/TadG family type IV pilus assembly protein [Kitasatospora sp. NPDC049258]|uniref:TadE/TadG family type IV pilus assembly protein n=1 Tax=Kitasatospora sp. NPDC049258 TaxID=3155394 RepID=UPI003412A9B7
MTERRPRPLLRAAGRAPSDRGSAAVEFTIWVPAAIILIALAMTGGRIIMAGNAVDAAAADAAREASLARTADEAGERARAAATQTFADQRLHCAKVDVQVDTSGFSAPLGQYGAVTATVTCDLTLSDLGLPVDGDKRMTGTFTSVIDRWRSRP